MTRPVPLLLAALLAAPAAAGAACDAGPTFTIRADNDVWGGAHQDQGYSAGGMLMLASPTLRASDAPACAPAGLRWLDRGSAWLGTGEARNVTFAIVQAIYTPMDREATTQDPDDRPFAGVLHLTAGRNVRDGDRLATTQLKLGIVGPSARAEQVQSAIHGLWGRSRFNGWDNQLRDEPVLALVHERAWRWNGPVHDGGLAWDFGTHAGGSVGNLATHLNGGAGIRFGRDLPDDFGSSPLRPGGENSAPVLRPRAPGLGWHLYASFDARAVAHDLSLDGSTWKDSHSVERKPLVADLTLGAVATWGPWRFAATHTRRTREFDGQREAPVFGTFAVSRDF
jgi:lipid A 3-O-deacylase